LCHATREALTAAIGQVRAGRPINRIGRAVEGVARRYRFRVIRNLGGHGVGRSLHEDPDGILSWFDPSDRRVLREGMVIAVEPFLSTATTMVREAADGWTLLADRGSRSAQFEHTMIVTRGAPIVLTLPPAP
jgi:methionyl aminopeptidase